MEVPKTFVKEKSKEATQEELEELIKKTLVDKILVENISQEIAKHLESELLARRIGISFRKTTDLEEKKLETVTEKYLSPSKEYPNQIRDNIKLDYDTRLLMFNQESLLILEKIIEIEPSLKEEEIIQKTNKCLNVLSRGVIYELSLDHTTNEKHVETGKKEMFKMDIYKRRIRTFFKKKLVKEENIDLPVLNVYHNFVIYGNIKYAKFNFEHNAKLLKALKGLGYDCSMNVLEDKCKK